MVDDLVCRVDGFELEEAHVVFDEGGIPHYRLTFRFLIAGRPVGVQTIVTDESDPDLLMRKGYVDDVLATFNTLKAKAEALFATHHGVFEPKLQPGEIKDY